ESDGCPSYAAQRRMIIQYRPPTQTRLDGRAAALWETAWRAWRDLAGDVQAAVTDCAKEQGTARHEVEADVKKVPARHPGLLAGG
ncbi:hypothetical protein, partial [Streptomyces afghaniensis]|uniref:hypothetical protein n=1 Tax=Streptomyces afghaniensis TaxID=66865 RepID=UPI00055E5F98